MTRAKARMPTNIVERLLADHKLRASHRIAEEELSFLESVELFGQLKSMADVLFVLKNIRGTRSSTSKRTAS